MMAKRSDFAQKLLDDLRLRKEKLGYASSGHQPSNAASRGLFSPYNFLLYDSSLLFFSRNCENCEGLGFQ